MTTALVHLESSHLSDLRCVRCGSELELNQPDSLRPDRLLAVCRRDDPACGRWHLVDIHPDGAIALVILLPDPDAMHLADPPVVPGQRPVAVLNGHGARGR